MAYLIKVPYFKEKELILDSQYITNGAKEILFKTSLHETDRQYKIRISKSHKEFYVIPDAKDIYITANNINGRVQISGSDATLSLMNFMQGQKVLIDSSAVWANILKTSAGNKSGKTLENSSKRLFDSLNTIVNNRYKKYADTVTNAAAFLSVYNYILFNQENFTEMQALLTSARKRFPESKSVKTLYDEGERLIDIYSTEFEVGDKLPFISLPDINNITFSTASLNNKYYLIDFWSGWCRNCQIYNHYKKLLYQSSKNKIEIVSVALDDDLQSIKSIIKSENLNWTQLIDTNMWQGKTVNTLKFDSIPMNFLVDPNGIIIGKAIKADSLVEFVNRKIK